MAKAPIVHSRNTMGIRMARRTFRMCSSGRTPNRPNSRMAMVASIVIATTS